MDNYTYKYRLVIEVENEFSPQLQRSRLVCATCGFATDDDAKQFGPLDELNSFIAQLSGCASAAAALIVGMDRMGIQSTAKSLEYFNKIMENRCFTASESFFQDKNIEI